MDMFEQAIEAKAMELESNFEKQMEDFDATWETKLEEYDNDVTDAKEKQINSMEEERERYSQELQQKLKISNKMSPKYLDMKKKLEGLAKAQLFEKAAELKVEIELEEEKCLQKHHEAINDKYNKLMEVHQIQAEKELKKLEQKIEICRKQLIQRKETDFRTMELKFKAQIKNFENKCGVERAQKKIFLEAFDPEKNVNVSKFYAQCIGERLKQENEE